MSRVEDSKPSGGLAGVFRNLGRLNRTGQQQQQHPPQQQQQQPQPQAQPQQQQQPEYLHHRHLQQPVPPVLTSTVSAGVSYRDDSGTPLPRGPSGSSSSAAAAAAAAVDGTYLGGPSNNHALFIQLKPGNPIHVRVAAAEAFRHIVVDYAISTVSAVWVAAQDLTSLHNPVEARHAAFKLLTACITQSDPSSLDRLIYFRAISEHHSANDFDLQLEALIALTNNGKDLIAFEREIQPLLTKWLRGWFREATAARQARKRENPSSQAMTTAEFNLQQLFTFLINVIKFNFKTFEESEIVPMLNEVLTICKKTTSKDDITRSLMFIDALITYGYVPRASLTPCIEVLCGAYATIRDLTEATWNAISNLCRSYMAHNSLLTLREILEAPSKKEQQPNTNTLRGAVCFLERLLIAGEEDGLPPLQFSTVMLSYQSALAANNGRLELDICRAIGNIFSKTHIIARIAFDEWLVPLDILVHCSKRTSDRMAADGGKGQQSLKKDKDGLSAAISQTLFQIITQFESQSSSPEFGPSEAVMDFFMKVHSRLPDSCAELVINYYATEHLCYPSCRDWLDNSKRLVDIFFKNSARPFGMRISILSLIKDVYETIKDVCDEHSLQQLILAVFDDMASEKDINVLEALVKVAIDVANDGNMILFTGILNSMVNCLIANQIEVVDISGEDVRGNESKVSLASSNGSVSRPSPANIITKGLAALFMQSLGSSAVKSLRVCEELIKVANARSYELDARLTAMRLLFRIRADSDSAICLVEDCEAYNLAAILARTSRPLEEGSSARNAITKGEDDSLGTSPSGTPGSSSIGSGFGSLGRSSSKNLHRALSRPSVEKYERIKPKNPLWSYPEARALPESVSPESSPVLFSYLDPSIPRPRNSTNVKDILQLEEWLDIIIDIFEKGCEWEIYSYVLVHSSSQLSNKTLFGSCKERIQRLRAIICEQLHNNKIPNTDLPAEVKKADLAVALIHTLTTLISYHEHFNKSDQEAIVKAFHLGLHSWQRTAKPCIHALSICCYELSMATSKFLPGILVKLSQIITTASVSVHILEFLSLLARLPNLYVNFTEPDFKSIFAIAFRYIQHTKELASASSSRVVSGGGGPGSKTQPSKDQPELQMTQDQPETSQYVLTLAYNVLATWFLSLRLNDRAKYVSWITRGLILGDGGHKDALDEQSQACIDMLRRFTYADQDTKLSAGKSSANTGVSMSKSWLLGLKVITIRTSLSTGMSQVTVRQPSGTASFVLKQESPHAQWLMQGFSSSELLASSGNGDTIGKGKAHETTSRQPSVMPSHVLMQLTADISASESSRPILLPDDDATNRALGVFDRIPVVDFHKVGVVYVGAGQTQETEILANVMGSSDYTDFVDGLGDLIPLKDSTINTGGLDREANIDGEFAYFWSDRITQIIFHVTTMMPTNRIHDPQCTNKKRHIGNDFVNIIFNNSGLPFKFDTIPAQFNFVNIVISPEARSGFLATRLKNYEDSDLQFYRVQLFSKKGIPELSPAAEPKMISGKSLSTFVRNLALNASVFSHVYNEGGGEHISNWRHRLRAINQLRERLGVPVAMSPTTTAASPMGKTSDISSRRISSTTVMSDRSNGAGEGELGNEMDGLLESYDFSKWGGA